MTFTLELTGPEARAVLKALRAIRPPDGKSVAERIKPFVASLPPEPVRCPHTRSVRLCGTFTSEPELARHLALVHHYLTSNEVEARGDKPEDTAETNAWTAFHRDGA